MGKSFEEKIIEERKNAKNNWNNRLESSFKLENFDRRQILETTHYVNLERDKNNMPIPGTGRLITEDENLQVIEYIEENDLPLTKKMYAIVLEEYLKDENLFNQSKGRKL